MNYWNQPNFQGLQALAEAFQTHDDLAQLGDYCRLREAGLRRDAFAALECFLTAASEWERSRAQAALAFLLECYARTTDCRQFLSQPLSERFVLPVLRQWLAREPAATFPLRWLGLLTRDDALLSSALAADPQDHEARRWLVSRYLYDVDYATHHLGESLFIGELADAREALAIATSLIADAPDREVIADLDREARTFATMLDDWQAYRAQRDGSFPQWCAERGREYGWPTTVYYDDGSA